MIRFLAYKTIAEVNTSQGPHVLFTYVNEITSGLFIRLILLALFLVIGIGGYLSSQRLSGRGDLAASFAIAGFVVVGATVIMSFIPGLITSFDIAVAIGVAILCVLWLYFSKRNP